ncbi:MAG: hypothetical protein DRO43_06360 [Candidatus Hecatellales archaeon]|nr:MAG: hypothetical protein DRO43_06360 [Candidatus Hecatellales archaeon]
MVRELREKTAKGCLQSAKIAFNGGKMSIRRSDGDYVLIERSFLKWMLTELRAIREKLMEVNDVDTGQF